MLSSVRQGWSLAMLAGAAYAAQINVTNLARRSRAKIAVFVSGDRLPGDCQRLPDSWAASRLTGTPGARKAAPRMPAVLQQVILPPEAGAKPAAGRHLQMQLPRVVLHPR